MRTTYQISLAGPYSQIMRFPSSAGSQQGPLFARKPACRATVKATLASMPGRYISLSPILASLGAVKTTACWGPPWQCRRSVVTVRIELAASEYTWGTFICLATSARWAAIVRQQIAPRHRKIQKIQRISKSFHEKNDIRRQKLQVALNIRE